jgi:HK97 family phage prohead protease
MKVEVRHFKPQVRAVGNGPKAIIGRPIVFNSLSEDLGGFRELVQPGAITYSDDLRADFDHDSKYILGTRSKGTLSISEDAAGVCMEANPPDTQWARDLAVSIERGDIEHGSFAFRVLPGGQKWSEQNGETIRTLTNILVSRVSVVSDPAYTATSLQVRSISEVLAERTEPDSNGSVDADLLRRKLELACMGG